MKKILVGNCTKYFHKLVQTDLSIVFDLNDILTGVSFEEQYIVVKDNDIYKIKKLK